MPNPEVRVQQLLHQHHFRLVRSTKHLVYLNPEGKVYVTSVTPSDHRFAHNQLTSLKRCLASPPVPMVIAISEYEREQAAAVIQAAPRATAGVSSGKHHRSWQAANLNAERRLVKCPICNAPNDITEAKKSAA